MNVLFFSPIIFVLGSLTYERNKEYQDEKTLWERDIERRPNNSVSYGLLGDYFYSAKQHELALENYSNAVEIASKNPRYRLMIADVLHEMNNKEKAIEQLSILCEMYPNFYTPHYRLGLIYHGMGDHAKAIKEYAKVIDFFPDHLFSLNNLSWLLAASSDESIRNARKSLELALKVCELSEYHDPSYLMTLAAAYAESGEFEKALKYIDQSIQIDPNQVRVKTAQKMKSAYQNREKIYFDQ